MILTDKVKHGQDFTEELEKAKEVVEYSLSAVVADPKSGKVIKNRRFLAYPKNFWFLGTLARRVCQ